MNRAKTNDYQTDYVDLVAPQLALHFSDIPSNYGLGEDDHPASTEFNQFPN